MKLFTNVQERVLILFLSFYFLLGAMKISDILPRRNLVKDKNTRSFRIPKHVVQCIMRIE